MYHHLVALYQNTSNYGPGVEIGPMLWYLGIYIEIKREISKTFLVPNTGCPASLKFLKNPIFFSLAKIPKKMKNPKGIPKNALIVSH